MPSEPIRICARLCLVFFGTNSSMIVAADPALDLREALGDFVAPRARPARAATARSAAAANPPAARTSRPTPARNAPAPVRQHRIDRHHVVPRHAVAQRARAAGIVARHAADGGARGSRDVDREPQAVRLELTVELVQHDARLHHARLPGHVERHNLVQMLRAVDDERMVHRLAALRGPAAARQHGHALGPAIAIAFSAWAIVRGTTTPNGIIW